MSDQAFDFVVIGAGSAGCIVAARLADAGASVLLLEAGAPATAHPETLSADGFGRAFANDALMWHRLTAKQAHCGGRGLYAGTGRGLGGSGSVNGMVYTRGDRRDFAAWPPGWQWDDVVPAFQAIEEKLQPRPRPPTPFAQRFLAASEAAGFARKDGQNDGDLGGIVGCNDMNYAGDERRSSYRMWLHQRRSVNLTVLTGVVARRLVFVDGAAVAVECADVKRFEVRREVVLCAGALETPKLLMLSGIGPGAQLQALGIDVVHDAPGVGENLQDHPNVCLFYRADRDVDFRYPQLYGFDAARRRDGDPPAAPDTCFVCFAAPPTLQLSMRRMIPVLALPGKLHDVAPLRWLLRRLVDFAFLLPPLQAFVARIFGIVVILGKPTSRGRVRLASRDPAVPAQVDPAYYATAQDRETMLAAVDKACGIAAQAPLAASQLLSKAAACGVRDRTWNWIAAATMTTFHFCGSCRMGEDDGSPVDLRLKLKGVRKVRIADASVIPEIPVSALNAPSMMVGWRAADFILQEKAA